jgi:hypothetical protein
VSTSTSVEEFSRLLCLSVQFRMRELNTAYLEVPGPNIGSGS